MTGTMTGAIEPVVVPTCSQHRLAACVGVMMPAKCFRFPTS